LSSPLAPIVNKKLQILRASRDRTLLTITKPLKPGRTSGKS
jgi:hypothetical protein